MQGPSMASDLAGHSCLSLGPCPTANLSSRLRTPGCPVAANFILYGNLCTSIMALVSDMFSIQAERKAPAIIFLDELDAIAPVRGQGGRGANLHIYSFCAPCPHGWCQPAI